MTWTDQSSAIRELIKRGREHWAPVALVAKDPACSDIGLDLYSGQVWLKTSGALSAESQATLLWDCDVVDTPLPPDSDTFFFVKESSFRVADAARPASDFFSYAQKAIGGPNALTTTLAGSALAGAAGYGIGTVADAVIPSSLRAVLPRHVPGGPQDQEHEMINGNSHWASTLGLMGAAAGAVPGLIRAGVASSAGHSILSPYPWTADLPKRASHPFEDAMDSTGALFQPSIPVDAFNQAIWSNAIPNPYGTKSGWGDNDAPMFTPPRDAALIGGLVSAAGAGRQASHVSPWDVARVATQAAVRGGAGAFMGAATGLMAGKVLGGLAGLSPAGQQYAQQTGLWAGLISGLASKLF